MPLANREKQERLSFAECSGCALGGHPVCLGLQPGTSTFQCDVCSLGTLHPPASCLVCEKRGGLLRRVLSDNKRPVFTHMACGMVSRRLKVNSFLDMSFELIVPDKKEKNRTPAGAKCEICLEKSGELLPCAHGDCGRCLHLYCFLNNRAENVIHHGLDKESKDFWALRLDISRQAPPSSLHRALEDRKFQSPTFLSKYINLA